MSNFDPKNKPIESNQAASGKKELTTKEVEIKPKTIDKKTKRKLFGFYYPGWVKVLAIVIAVIFVFSVGSVAGLFVWFAKDLPNPSKLESLTPSESTKIFDRNGLLLYEVHGERKRTIIPLDQMSDYIKKATIASEDKDFYRHKGFALSSFVRAAFNKLVFNERLEGTSTITQQFVKNALLTNERSFARKIKELILAIEIEQIHSKDEILAMYLNQIPYGNNAYGIEAAAQTFFGKRAKDLTLAEAATLAVLPRATAYYSPYGGNKTELFAKRDSILDKMRDQGFISQQQLDDAKKQKMVFVPFKEKILAPHFVMYVRQVLEEKYGQKMLEEGGLRVTTTLDYKLQKEAEKMVKAGADRNAIRYRGKNAALVALDPKTGQILTMVGSRDYWDTKNDGNVNVATALRQPGSSFKPYVYATAFKGKYGPGSPIWDVATDFGFGYKPLNYNKHSNGLLTIRKALAGSLNVPAAKMTSLVGVENVIGTVKDLGITSFGDPSNYGIAIGLGAGEVKLIEHASAFGSFGVGGEHHASTPILKVTNSKGDLLEEYQDVKTAGLDPQVAYLITSILTDNKSRSFIFGSSSPLYFPNRTVACKTGTTQNNRDCWTMATTPELTVGVWTGNNDNSEMTSNADGVNLAAPIMHSFVEFALAGKKDIPFAKPKGIQEVKIDKVSGKLPTEFSPSFTTDLFASWSVPKDKDDVHVAVETCKVSNKLVGPLCPAAAIVRTVYANIHSEMPDNPNWEKPVLAAAKSLAGQKLGTPPKTGEICDKHVEANRPTLSLTAPTDGAAITGPFNLKGTSTTPLGLKEIVIYVDNIKVLSFATVDFDLNYTPIYQTGDESKSHVLKAVVFDKGYWDASASVTLQYNLPTPIPTTPAPTPTPTP